MAEVLKIPGQKPARRLRKDPERTVAVEFVPVASPAVRASKTASILRIFRSALVRQASREKKQDES